MIKVEAEIDETTYGLLCKPADVKPLMEALNRLYGHIWIESCYDPYNDATKKLCRLLLDDIQIVNGILHFKK